MESGYYIELGRIYGPSGYTGYGINNSNRIVGARGDTRHWVYREYIYSAKGNSGYWIKDKKILGPGPFLPWEQPKGRKKKGSDDSIVC